MVGSDRRKRRRGDVVFVQGNEAAPDAEAGRRQNDAAPAPGSLAQMKAAEIRYKDWRRNGSPHDEACFSCHKTNDVHDCETCRRSYHERCLDQPLSKFFHGGKFFCDVCLDRQWHRNAPPLSPPPTPPRETAEIARVPLPVHSGTSKDLPPSAPVVSTNASLPPPTSTRELRPMLPTPSTLDSWQNPRPRLPPPAPQSASNTPIFPRSMRTLLPSTPINAPNSDAHNDSTARSSRSRFSSLSNEVDDAIFVILRELEYLGDAKQKNAQLEDVIRRLEQDVKINQNARIIAERCATAGSSKDQSQLAAENDQLKKELERLQALLREHQARADTHQRERDNWMAEAKKNEAELEQWKTKLKTLLGNET